MRIRYDTNIKLVTYMEVAIYTVTAPHSRQFREPIIKGAEPSFLVFDGLVVIAFASGRCGTAVRSSVHDFVPVTESFEFFEDQIGMIIELYQYPGMSVISARILS